MIGLGMKKKSTGLYEFLLAEELFVQTILPKLRPEDEYHLVYEVGEDNGTGVELTHTCEQGLYTVRARL